VALQDYLRLITYRRRRGRGKKDRDTGDEAMPSMILSGTLKMIRMNRPITTSSTAFLRV
jgi:hypothetical protein